MTYLIAGLGNPGKEYEGTRHNFGSVFVLKFLAVLADRGVSVGNLNSHENYRFVKVKIEDNDIVLVIPQTYMNLSGEAVERARNYYKIATESVVVVSDDVYLTPGVARLRFGGSDGGHKGLKSVIEALGEGFWRLRIGVGLNEKIPLEDFVLEKPAAAELELINQCIDEQVENMLELILENKLTNNS